MLISSLLAGNVVQARSIARSTVDLMDGMNSLTPPSRRVTRELVEEVRSLLEYIGRG